MKNSGAPVRRQKYLGISAVRVLLNTPLNRVSIIHTLWMREKQQHLITAPLHQVSNPNIYQNFIVSLFLFRTVIDSCR